MPQRVLNVAEKNDAAKELSKIMSHGRSQRREGHSKFNKIYEFTLNILGQDSQMVMTSVSGHLMTLDFIPAFKNWLSCPPGSLFTAQVLNHCPENFLPIKRTLEQEAKKCQHLILWTDGDREGENIAWEIAEVCKKVRPRITIHRARFSEITPRSIQRAYQNLEQLNEQVSQAVETRKEVDLRIGCAFTRFQTLRLTKVFPTVLNNHTISYGPCQFPTLGFVVDRYKQVQAFVPETFYKIKVTHTTDEASCEFHWKRVRLFHHTACLVLYQICMEDPVAKVISIQRKSKSKWRPVALDTVELEKIVSRKLKINAKETMRITEKLYTQGYISYPRTETNMFPDSFDLRSVVEAQTVDSAWGVRREGPLTPLGLCYMVRDRGATISHIIRQAGFASQVLSNGPNPRQGRKTDNAHPPIHPVKHATNLEGNEKRIYEFIVRHFLACCSQDAQGEETTVEIDIANERFTTQGLVIIARNYLDVYPYEVWNAKTIPRYREGDSFPPTAIEMVEGETSPPPLLQEADLIALMEKHGIGTDATHAEHIETIKQRQYVGVNPDGSFVPGELGMGLVEGYDAMGYELSKPNLRAEMEADLVRICRGEKRAEEVLRNTIQKYQDVFNQAVTQAQKLDEALSQYFGSPQAYEQPSLGSEGYFSEPVRKCPICKNSDMAIKKKRDGCYVLTCLAFPDCKAAQFFPSSVLKLTLDHSTCDQCRPPPVKKLKFKLKRGSVPPFMGEEYIGCSGCDVDVKEALSLRDWLPQGHTTTIHPTTSAAATTAGRSTAARRAPPTAAPGPGRGRGRGGGGTSRKRKNPYDNDNDSGCVVSSLNGVSGGFHSSQPHSSTSRNYSSGYGSQSFSSGRQPPLSSLSAHSSGYGSRSTSSAFIPTSMDTTTDNHVVCSCGTPAILLTVKNPSSSNLGRQFYKCSKREGGCDFFLWADSPPNGGASSSTTMSSSSSYHGRDSSQSYNRGNTTGYGSDPNCKCGSKAVKRTVQKDGPNKGKQFYTCAKPRENQCGFFQWTEDSDSMNNTTSSYPHHTGGAPGYLPPIKKPRSSTSVKSESNSGTTTKRKCSVCRQEGHTKRNCPQLKHL